MQEFDNLDWGVARLAGLARAKNVANTLPLDEFVPPSPRTPKERRSPCPNDPRARPFSIRPNIAG